MSQLFSPFSLKSITLKNRIAVAPMCQYQAKDGLTNEWHHVHYASLARGGAGLVVVEATAVSPEGRITPRCLGLWNNEQAAGLAKVASSIKGAGAVAGIQIAHAGRKASAHIPWEGDDHIKDGEEAWDTISPSNVPFGANLGKVPKAMTKADIERVKADFVAAAKRALDAGFEWLELHFAHGYLAQSFFSTYANQRTDEYGGDAAGRGRFLLETLAAVREVWPDHLPLTARFGVIEFDDKDEQTLNESIQLVKQFKQLGLDMLNVSICFSTPTANVPWSPAFLAPIAERVRREVGLPVATSWGMDNPHHAEQSIQDEQMDLVMIGKAFLANPNYPYQMAQILKVSRPSWVLPSSYAHWLERYSTV
ncbi:NADH:flavin oxidoreductase/NADH oxidase [Shewanella acanthi]|uniref:NADH:flavin oxidoreductase/NADH oxidase n=1 Tax=Shewanella acanthi TaxID=2864212 RepID=UPI001C655B08|nr:NADH:flavin oxidoreductase/NADH oxidase [Shewanella acanthi]QYJ77529.1 NADH:flavin oxidoreductase/NADH oxidase [Shewanella acanthi]